jgi:hypothetical protein
MNELIKQHEPYFHYNIFPGNQYLALNATKEELIREHLILPRLQVVSIW